MISLIRFVPSAAIAARIAATMSGVTGGAFGSGSPSNTVGAAGEKKDQYDGAFTHDIEINDLRNRYLITKGSTQQQVSHFPCLGLVSALAGLCISASLTTNSADIARNRRVSNHQRCLAPRQVKGRTIRTTPLHPHFGTDPIRTRRRREKGQRSHQPGTGASGGRQVAMGQESGAVWAQGWRTGRRETEVARGEVADQFGIHEEL